MVNSPPRTEGRVEPATAARPEGDPGREADPGGRHGLPKRSFWSRNALGLICFAIFVLLLFGQSLTGWQSSNDDLETHGQPTQSYVSYLDSGAFAEATFENWESEFLQMAAFIVLTVWLVQRGSAESKQEGHDERDDDPRAHAADPGAPWPVRRGGVWLKVYENSLLIAFVLLFLLSVAGHALGGAAEYSQDQQMHGEAPVSVAEFVTTDQFWFESLQNWQSEFLAVFSIAMLSIFLRQKGSSQSKPVHAPDHQTGG